MEPRHTGLVSGIVSNQQPFPRLDDTQAAVTDTLQAQRHCQVLPLLLQQQAQQLCWLLQLIR
jgi:hypothetical protein